MQWNDDSGNWQGLGSPDQAPRYARIAELIGPAPESVLDVGSGKGLLRKFLPWGVYYVGIEPSAKAIIGRCSIEHTTAERFMNYRRWDWIVFNEMLYYSNDPIALLRKFSQYLMPKGKILVSIYQRRETVSFLRLLATMLLYHNRPLSNVHCTAMISEFLSDECWQVEVNELVAERWRMFVARPR